MVPLPSDVLNRAKGKSPALKEKDHFFYLFVFLEVPFAQTKQTFLFVRWLEKGHHKAFGSMFWWYSFKHFYLFLL